MEARIQSYELAYRMQMDAADAFDISKEPKNIREMYGPPLSATAPPAAGSKMVKMVSSGERPGSFGQGCLMARRLVEAGVPFVEVVMGDGVGWDTHRDNFPRVRALSLECDAAMAALEMVDLLAKLPMTPKDRE